MAKNKSRQMKEAKISDWYKGLWMIVLRANRSFAYI